MLGADACVALSLLALQHGLGEPEDALCGLDTRLQLTTTSCLAASAAGTGQYNPLCQPARVSTRVTQSQPEFS